MSESQNSGASQINGEVPRDSRWSEEYDQLPLKQRLKLLFAQKGFPEMLTRGSPEVGENSNSSTVTNNVVVKEEEEYDSESLYPASFAGEEKIGNLSTQQSSAGGLNDQVTEANQMMNATVAEEKVNVIRTGSFQHSLLSKNAVSLKVKGSDKSSSSLSGKCRNSSSGVDIAAFKVKAESTADIFDDLDLVPLKERQGMLLSSQKMGFPSSSAKGNPMQLSSSVDNMTKEKNQRVSKEFPVARNQVSENQKNLYSSSKLPHQGRPSSPLEHPGQHNRSSNAGNMRIIKEKKMASSFKKTFFGFEANVGKHPSLGNTTVLNPVVKTEALDENETIENKIPAASLPSADMVPVKSEHDADSDTDELDHMLLSERMKLFSKKAKVCLEIKRTESSSKVVPSGLDNQPIVPEAVKRQRIDCSRKRRKTATDSVETALEEDAPGLLQELIEKGVSIDEIKLYGQMEGDEALDDLSNDDNFAELESVIAKIFSQRTSLLKLAPLRCPRGERRSYCLACLFSLVEQAHYLQFRKWPVEWGWSRDLQSFIFVFNRHNRIVLERPEYGYATYFFELVDYLSVDWQIKRLVTGMKLTSSSRITLIENKALEVGQDLTEGEAKVLMEYGWIPNTGLGTMLNYCDRVVHDKKSEKDTSEWRSKIGKLLVDGYNGGAIVSTELPRKAVEFKLAQIPEIKLEVE